MSVALLAGACGEPSEEEFATEVDEVCLEEAEAFEDLSEATPQGSPELADQIERAVTIREDALADLEALDPPDEQSAAFADYLEGRRQALEIQRAAAQAAGRDDRETLDVATATLTDLTSEADLTAAQLGADECVSEPGED